MTLAAAEAETGDFPRARSDARKALGLARSQGDSGFAAEIERYLPILEKNQPLRLDR